VTQETVRLWLKLLTLKPELLAAVERGDISMKEALMGTKVVNGVPKKPEVMAKVDALKSVNMGAATALLWSFGMCDETFLMETVSKCNVTDKVKHFAECHRHYAKIARQMAQESRQAGRVEQADTLDGEAVRADTLAEGAEKSLGTP